MRDGLSVLDQVLALSEGGLTADAVERVLGVIGEERYLQLFDILIRRDQRAMFDLVEELVEHGYDLVEFYHGLMDGLRTLLRLRVGGSAPELSEESRRDWEDRAERFEPADLVRMLTMAADIETEGSLRRTAQPQVLIELLLLRFTYLDRTVDLEALLGRVGPEGSEAVDSSPERSGGNGPMPTSTQPEAEQAAEEERTAPTKSPGPTDVLAMWQTLLREGKGVPRGMLTLLRGTDARVDAEGALELRLIAGPVLERLRGGEQKDLEEALARTASRGIPIRLLELPDSNRTGQARISPEEVRQGRLRDLLEREPGLGRAVEELDLELLE